MSLRYIVVFQTFIYDSVLIKRRMVVVKGGEGDDMMSYRAKCVVDKKVLSPTTSKTGILKSHWNQMRS